MGAFAGTRGAVARGVLVLGLVLMVVGWAEGSGAGAVSKVNHPRPPLLKRQGLAREAHNSSAGGGGVPTAKKDSSLDPANLLVVVIAALILVYASHRALRPPFMDMSPGSGEAMAYEEQAEAGEMQLQTAFVFVVVASCSLMLIFYFMSAMAVLITILFSFIAALALGALVYPYADAWTNNRFSKEIDIPWLGPIPQLFFVLLPFCAAVVLGWLLTKSWILNNVLAISLIIFFLTSVRLSSLKVASALLILAFFYDIFWVFLSSNIFGQNVMVKVATGLDVPIKILVPLFFSTGTDLQFTLIGLGDIVLPGLLLCFAMRFDDSKGVPLTAGYFAATMVGYCVGLTVCEIVVGCFHLAQPAMIYLVPGTLIPFAYMAHSRGELGEAWEGLTGHSTHQRLSDDGV